MSQIKFVSPQGWAFDRPAAQQVPVGSRGLRGHDRTEFLKTASHLFLPHLDRIKIAEGEVPIHLIAMGAYEAWGPNRNGDAFKEAACREYYPTFTKFAQFYRNHKNKPEKGHPSFGKVAAAAYNEDMRRIELLCLLNGNEKAAQANKGLVADRELEKLAQGKDIPVSMACRVPYDECSFCQKQAAVREDYCTADSCGAGGCADHLAQIVKVGSDLHHLHVINDYPTWFDISGVVRPADRTAYGSTADYLTKVAADIYEEIEGTVKTAATQTAPLSVLLSDDGFCRPISPAAELQIKLAYGLAQLEQQEEREGATGPWISQPFPVEKLASYGTEACDQQLAAMADMGIILSLQDFARLTRQESHLKTASARVTRMFRDLTENDQLPGRLAETAHPLTVKVAGQSARSIAVSLRNDYSLRTQHLQDRAILNGIRGLATNLRPTVKTAAVASTDNSLLLDFAHYTVASLYRVADTARSDFPLTARFALRQNRFE